MAYTSDDVTRIDTAIADFISGDRRSSVKFRDGREISFANVTLTELQSIRVKIMNDVNRSKRPRTSVFITSKGL